MGKASEVARQLSEQAQARAEAEPPSPHPELRLREGMVVDVEPGATVSGVLSDLQGSDAIAMHDVATGSRGVMLSSERYLQLMGIELMHAPKQHDSSGRIYPAALESSNVEQIDPSATWVPVDGRH